MTGLIFKVKEVEVFKTLVTQESLSSQLPQKGDWVDFSNIPQASSLGKRLVISRNFIYSKIKKEVRDIEIELGGE